MLHKLKIINYTLIEHLEIEFENGFQVLTGETGAGKSIVVGAINLLCGQRGQNEIIRSGAEKSILEAEYKVDNNKYINDLLKSFDIDSFDKFLLVRREFSRNGMNRVFINDTPSTLNQLSNITSLLIDIHGQHQHQKLLYAENHGKYLDSFASLKNDLDNYNQQYKTYAATSERLTQFYNKKKSSIDQGDLLSFQVAELDKANLDETELEQIKSEKLILENSENLFEIAEFVSQTLYSSEESVLKSVSKTLNRLIEAEKIDEKYKDLSNNLNSAQLLIEEVGRSAEWLKQKIEFNPDKLEELREREAAIEWLLKKYQKANISDLIAHHKKIKSELSQIQNYDQEIIKLENELDTIKNKLSNAALQISQVRIKQSQILKNKMNEVLVSLGMNNANFEIDIKWLENQNGIIEVEGKRFQTTERGADKIEFLISLNKGEPLKPLQKVASGGEISRIMLAIKSILNEIDDTETLIFDEIDNGISGKIAQIVGNKFQAIGENKQLIVITHLPQIASQAKHQYLVEKNETDDRTYIILKKLSEQERINEIAKLLGGKKLTEEAIANARILLNDRTN